MTDVTVVIGAGGIGQAIARRISSGRHILGASGWRGLTAGCSGRPRGRPLQPGHWAARNR